jgi:hypothetical protein
MRDNRPGVVHGLHMTGDFASIRCFFQCCNSMADDHTVRLPGDPIAPSEAVHTWVHLSAQELQR